MQFRGRNSTFRSRGDRSGGAYEAESGGLESARDAAKRLHVRPWINLQKLSTKMSHSAAEWHHHRVRFDGLTQVVEVDYRDPREWTRIVRWCPNLLRNLK